MSELPENVVSATAKSQSLRLAWNRSGRNQTKADQSNRAQALSLAKTGRRSDEFELRMAKLLHFGAKKRVRLYLKFERFTTQGIPLKRAVEIIWARLNRSKDRRRAVFGRLNEHMGEGETFTNGMAPYLPGAERLLIFAGESSGKVQNGFAQAAYVAKAVNAMRNAVTSTLAYPAVLFVMLCMILWGMSTEFIPILLQIAPLSQWPTISLVLYYVATTVQVAGLWILIGLGIGGALVMKSLPTWTGPARAFADKWLPPYTTYREYQGSIFLISLAALIQSGRPDSDAIKQLAQISRPWLRAHLTKMHTALLTGVTPGIAFDTGLLSAEVCGDVEDYTTAGGFDQAVAQIGTETVEDAIVRISTSASLVKYVMMAMVAGSILLIYSGIIFVVLDVARRAQSGAM